MYCTRCVSGEGGGFGVLSDDMSGPLPIFSIFKTKGTAASANNDLDIRVCSVADIFIHAL